MQHFQLLNGSQIGCMTDRTRVQFGLKATGRQDRSIHGNIVKSQNNNQ